MKILQPINHNFAIWSFLCGDFELKNNIKLLNRKLIYEPDLFSPLENTLRWEVFKSRRNWIAKDIGEMPSFALIEYTYKDLCSFNSVFGSVKFGDFAKEYMRAYKDKDEFKIKNAEKPYSSVVYEHKIKQKLEKEYKPVNLEKVLDTKYNNIDNISIALNRAFFIQQTFSSTIRVMDGHHRLSAYYWAKKENKKKLPDKLYGFYWRENYNS
jgi:hypothetical protein